MTMMMPTPEDNEFETLLADYAAPLEDEGFTARLEHNIRAQEIRLMRLRFMCLAISCTLGGIIAGTQFNSLLNLLGAYDVQAISLWGIAAFLVFAFVVWATVDNRDAGLV